jgi:hypothetical protein
MGLAEKLNTLNRFLHMLINQCTHLDFITIIPLKEEKKNSFQDNSRCSEQPVSIE